MFGIVFATFGAPAISGLVRGNGYGMNVVFGIGAVFAVIAFVCLTLLGRNLVKSVLKNLSAQRLVQRYKLPESDISARIIVRMRKLERIDHDVTAFMSI